MPRAGNKPGLSIVEEPRLLIAGRVPGQKFERIGGGELPAYLTGEDLTVLDGQLSNARSGLEIDLVERYPERIGPGG